MSMASLSVTGAGKVSVARMGAAAKPAAAKPAALAGAFFAPKSASKLTMSATLAGTLRHSC